MGPSNDGGDGLEATERRQREGAVAATGRSDSKVYPRTPNSPRCARALGGLGFLARGACRPLDPGVKRGAPVRQRRDLEVKFHVDDAEYAALRERWVASGLDSIAAYVRQTALGRPPAEPARHVPAINQEQYAALARAAGNLNQLARHANQGAILTDRDMIPVLRQIYEDVQQVRRLLLGMEPATGSQGLPAVAGRGRPRPS